MATRLDKTLKRELEIDGNLYTLTLTPEGVKITAKGARKGPEHSWRDLLRGDGEPRREVSASAGVNESRAAAERSGRGESAGM